MPCNLAYTTIDSSIYFSITYEIKNESKTAGRAARSGKKSAKDSLLDKDRDLFEELRTLRKEIADSEDISAYQVFGDAALVEMAQQRPQDDSAFLRISRVG